MKTEHDPSTVWDIAKKVGTAMFITRDGVNLEGRPLAGFPEPDTGLIYFMTDGETVLEQVADLAVEEPAEVVDGREIDACRRLLVERGDRAVIQPRAPRNVRDGSGPRCRARVPAWPGSAFWVYTAGTNPRAASCYRPRRSRLLARA